tara:strand:+ start:740 stop:1237 length:498 start_codon:yes stop_codon:yes gene_type:complete
VINMSWFSIIKTPFWNTAFQVKTNFPEADIWLQTRGSEQNVGKPLKQFSPVQGKYNFGIKIPEGWNKDYVFKQLADLYRKGHWKIHSYGTLSLQNIRKDDILRVLDGLENKKDYKDETSQRFQEKYETWLAYSKVIAEILGGHSSELVREGREIKRFIEKLEGMR